MRENKYRAWIKSEKRWYGDDIKWFPLRALYNEDGCSDDLIFVQYTGLKDWNGKEIYESDLWRLGDEVYEIMWVEGDWQTGWKKLAGANLTDIGSDTARRGEIIGNIIENPKLIETGERAGNEKKRQDTVQTAGNNGSCKTG